MMRLLTTILLVVPFAAWCQSSVSIDMTAQMSGSVLLSDGMTTKIWAFRVNGQPATLPNSSIDIRVGDTVNLTVFNASQMKHTVHLHGLDVDQANDGVESTSQAINPFGSFTYTFIPEHAGMYFYHCHIESTIHVQLGMYGLVIVRPQDEKTAWTGGPSFDNEYNWLLSDLDFSWHEDAPENGSIPVFEPDYFLINGKSTDNSVGDTSIELSGKVGEKLFLRIGNMGYGETTVHFPNDITAEVLVSDGRPLPNPFTTSTVSLYPGERYELLLTASAPLTDHVLIEYKNMQNDVLGENQVAIAFEDLVAIDHSYEQKAVAYPNPAENVVILPKSSNGDLTVFDILGNAHVLEVRNHHLDMSTLPSGIYLIHSDNRVIRIVKN